MTSQCPALEPAGEAGRLEPSAAAVDCNAGSATMMICVLEPMLKGTWCHSLITCRCSLFTHPWIIVQGDHPSHSHDSSTCETHLLTQGALQNHHTHRLPPITSSYFGLDEVSLSTLFKCDHLTATSSFLRNITTMSAINKNK